MTSKEPKSAWGQYVLHVMAKHQTNPTGQRARTKLAHTTIHSWLDDVPPKRAGVIQFASGMEEDVSEALRIAGYLPDDSPYKEFGAVPYERFRQVITERNAWKERSNQGSAEVLLYVIRRYQELQQEYPDRHFPLPVFEGGPENLTQAEAEAIMDDIADKLRRGVIG